MSEWGGHEAAAGVVPLDGRGARPFELVHGESLVATASFALEAAEIDLLDALVSFDDFRATGRDLVLHDPLCPLTPPAFLAEAVAQSREHDVVVVGCRPVTDTIKTYADTRIGATVDRDALVEVVSPIVLPGRVVATLTDFPSGSFDEVVQRLRAITEVRLVEAPALARRVDSAGDLRLLEALSGAQA